MGGAVSLQSESGEGLFAGGTGAANDPYQIATAEELWDFAELVNNKGETTANAILTDDIVLNEKVEVDENGTVTNKEDLSEWTPIGSISKKYSGTFNGDGHTISGLYIDSSDNDYQGLFGYLSTDGGNIGTVKDLSVSGSVSGGNTVGGVLGQNSGTVENCYNTGSVTSSGSPVGGVVGYNDIGGSVTNCYNTGTVTGTDDYVGGVGGVVGWNISSGNVTNCYNTGAVSGGEYVGGVVGYNRGTVTGCYFLKQNGMNESLQGIGDGSGTTGATVVTTLDALCDALKSDPWSISPFYNHPVLKTNPEGGDGTAAHPYEIKTAAQLETFRYLVNNGIEKSAHAKLMNNINLSSVCGPMLDDGQPVSWTPIGNSSDKYTGTFNGQNFKISGLYIDTDDYYQGLFGYVYGGTVKDLTVSGTVSGGMYVGGVVGDNNGGTVENCHNIGEVSGNRVGGVVGYNNGGTVKDLTVSGTVSGDMYVGGVVGLNGNGSVENCYNTGNVSGPDSVNGETTVNAGGVGGVVGYNGSSSTVENCYNTGNVSVTSSDISNVGGVVGRNDEGHVTNCYNTGEVSGPDSGSDNNVGGVVGYNNGGSVTGCYYQIDKGATVGIGGTTGDNSSQTEVKSLKDFHSGEVAYLLQGTQTTPVWGQSDLNTPDSWPTLIALDKNAKTVYQVTLKYDHAGAQDKTYYTDDTATPSEQPSRDGYTFDSWDKTGEGTTTITYTAKWTAIPATYTVTFDSQGGSAVNDQTVTEGQTITEPAAPTRDGYTFAGWFTESSGGSQWNFSTAVTKNMTLYAQWTEITPDPTPTPTPDPEPSGPSTGDSTGWDDILDELENTAKGDEITIDMGDETKVPAEIFETLAGQDITLEIALEGGVTWTVNGQDIPADANLDDLDLGVEMDSDGIPVDVVNSITGERDTVQMTLAHDGDFGFTMTLTAPLGAENAGYWANLYHYDEDAEQLTFETAAEIDADGSVSLSLSHASQYAIVIDTHSHATVDVSDLFSDIAPDAWYKDAIQYAYDNGLMTGVSTTEFAPEATTTRAMIVSILARLENVTTAEAAGFADVDDNDWYATAVNWAANVGVVNGYEDNTFRPNTAITREQLAAILMNYAAYKGEDVSNRADLANYTDQPSTWAQEAMQWAVAEGLISGVTADTLQPQGAATRAQVAAILQRFLSE